MLEEAGRNAGALADKIDFRLMNAEKLTFADHSFDVLVTRNVTWNLHDPGGNLWPLDPGAGPRRAAAEL